MRKKGEISEVISEMMSCLDTAVDRLHDVADLLDLSHDESRRLKKDAAALESAITALKEDFRSSKSLDSEVQKNLEAYLR